MTRATEPPAQLLAQFEVSDPVPLAQTAIAKLWRVTRADGQPAVLKVYGAGGMGSEAQGFRFLAASPPDHAAQVYATRPDAALIEWLEGPSLGDMARARHDLQAAEELLRVASGLHRGAAQPTEGYPLLTDRFAALFDLGLAEGCDPQLRAAMARARSMARELLSSQVDLRPLHGDLHHDNIRKARRGYCAFDAKGLVGERSYELANAFRHPKGCEDLIREPRRILALADLWSAGFGVDRLRLLQWAAAKCALSIAWRSQGRLSRDPELPLLTTLLSCAEKIDE
ncbi:aminoglycoside phosphotransferase family protein [Phaeobacter sp. PT47_59]|uniref:aminoglycoside phosphotransferase family protein n=1 Tax=Phaeobacter sp. PT47_59 TaxID=3029979 RepID=UPI0023807F06|nr:aminoglycoside phosphotransferase family protein [Phaeobacter sp. PT47_59]MDE4173526.1 aminoglycoside phosphotransferase family protein [Phaeobacter sp. PT47_59]